jgi:hypothetical protein
VKRTVPAVCAALTVSIALAVAACGGDDTNDPRVAQIDGTTELAVYAYASSGADGLYDYVAPSVTAKCDRGQFAAALKDQQQPTDFRGVENVTFDGQQAHVHVNLIFHNDEHAVDWTFVQAEPGSWRLVSVPGIGSCAP